MDKLKFCALIPSYNEEPHIAEVVRRTRQFVDDVIVYDDGSSDNSVQEAESAGATVIRHPQNMGKGATLADGMDWAAENGYDAVLTLDADGQHLPEEIQPFLDAIQNAEMVVGSRMAERKDMPFVRWNTNLFMSWVVSKLAHVRIPDSQCGFRMISTKAWKSVEVLSRNFDFESEVLVAIGRAGYRITDVPISTVYGTEVSKINPVKDTIRFFKMVWRLWWARSPRGAKA